MLSLPSEAEVLEKLISWASGRDDIRAMVMTSTRTRLEKPVDLLSDYDIVLVVPDPETFLQTGWKQEYGVPMIQWGDEGSLLGATTTFRGVIYEDGVKIDWSVWPVSLPFLVGAEEKLPDSLDVGYRVLLDKDGLTGSWKEPTYRAHIPAPPTDALYQELINEFWWSASYVAKALWRGEIVFAKWCLEDELRTGILRRFLEWQLEIERGWSIKPGLKGRGLERLVPPETWSELRATYVGAELEDNWAALFALIRLFRKVAQSVGSSLGFEYPEGLDAKASGYLLDLKQLDVA